jgi:hypothetical protein
MAKDWTAKIRHRAEMLGFFPLELEKLLRDPRSSFASGDCSIVEKVKTPTMLSDKYIVVPDKCH